MSGNKFPPGNQLQRVYKNLADRILSALVFEPAPWGDEPCWVWTRARSRDGYPRLTIRVNGYPSGRWAHRLAYEIFTGQKIPDGMTLDHKCCRRACCNPKHLEILPRGENTRRMWTRRRSVGTV